jgi:hypothetical protein
MAFVICRRDTGVPQYYTADVGRDFGNAAGAWIGEDEKRKALQFGRRKDVRAFLRTFMPTDEPNCEPVLYEPSEQSESTGA